jgi:hypothetical protein
MKVLLSEEKVPMETQQIHQTILSIAYFTEQILIHSGLECITLLANIDHLDHTSQSVTFVFVKHAHEIGFHADMSLLVQQC